MVYREIDADSWYYREELACEECKEPYQPGDTMIVGTEKMEHCPCAGCARTRAGSHYCMRCAREKGIVW